MDSVWPYVAALVPTVVVAAFFYAIIKRIVEGDRRERLAQRRFEDEQDARGSRRAPDGRGTETGMTGNDAPDRPADETPDDSR